MFDINQYICVVGKTYVKRSCTTCVARIYYSRYMPAPLALTYVKCYIRDM